MSKKFGTIRVFEEGLKNWSQYVERLGHILTANGHTDDVQKRAVFLSMIGPKAYQLLSSLVVPTKPGEKS